MMEKKLYELKVNEKFEHLIPPLQEAERPQWNVSVSQDVCGSCQHGALCQKTVRRFPN